MVILGGIGTLLGPVLGALALLLLEDVLSALDRSTGMVILGPLLIAASCCSRKRGPGRSAGRCRRRSDG